MRPTTSWLSIWWWLSTLQLNKQPCWSSTFWKKQYNYRNKDCEKKIHDAATKIATMNAKKLTKRFTLSCKTISKPRIKTSPFLCLCLCVQWQSTWHGALLSQTVRDYFDDVVGAWRIIQWYNRCLRKSLFACYAWKHSNLLVILMHVKFVNVQMYHNMEFITNTAYKKWCLY